MTLYAVKPYLQFSFDSSLLELRWIWITIILLDELRVKLISKCKAYNNRDILCLKQLDPLFCLVCEDSPIE